MPPAPKKKRRNPTPRDVVPGFAAAVRAARDARGLSREALARIIGSSASGLTQMEQESRAPSFRLAVALARELRISLDQFARR